MEVKRQLLFAAGLMIFGSVAWWMFFKGASQGEMDMTKGVKPGRDVDMTGRPLDTEAKDLTMDEAEAKVDASTKVKDVIGNHQNVAQGKIGTDNRIQPDEGINVNMPHLDPHRPDDSKDDQLMEKEQSGPEGQI